MKILQINSHYNQSGAGKVVTCIHRNLKKHGHASMVAYGRGSKTTEENVYRIGSCFETWFEGFTTRVIGIHGFTSWVGTKKLIKEISKFKPEVIHLHGLHGYYLNFRILFEYINKENIPCVWTFHDCHAFSGNCGYHYECELWKTGCTKCKHIKEYPTSMFFDLTKYMWKRKKELFTATDKKIIVSPSDWMTADAKESFFGKYQCVTINNGIDTDSIFYDRGKKECRDKHGYSYEDKIVLGIAFGFDDPRKGVKYILQLAKDLKDKNVKVILIGWNSKNDSLLSGLDNVYTLPFTNDQHELAEYYSLADVFVLTSLAENYATVVLEAMACGTPVVGFDVGGTAEQLAGGRGVVVNAGDSVQFLRAVHSVLDGTACVVESKERKDFIANNNSIASMTSKYEDIYCLLLDN